jgi:sec-independent protein translocase protein TatA
MGHWFEILIILALALLVFGPKRMIEMGSSLGKAFRELRNAAKEMDWSSLTGQNETTSRAPSPPAQPRYTNPTPPSDEPPPEEQIVEGSLVDAKEAVNETVAPSAVTSDHQGEQTHPDAEGTTEAKAAEATERPS